MADRPMLMAAITLRLVFFGFTNCPDVCPTTMMDIEGWLALTGPVSEIAKAAEAFRVRYEKIPQEDGGYTMNHTAGVFLFRRGGAFAGIIDFHEDCRFALPKIRRATG